MGQITVGYMECGIVSIETAVLFWRTADRLDCLSTLSSKEAKTVKRTECSVIESVVGFVLNPTNWVASLSIRYSHFQQPEPNVLSVIDFFSRHSNFLKKKRL